MSAGVFITTGYQATYDSNQFHPIRVQEETEALSLNVGGTNILNEGVPNDQINNPISAKVSKTRREIGLGAAKVSLRWTNEIPNTYDGSGILVVPLLNSAIRAVGRGATGTYLNNEVEVIGVTPESVR